MTIQIEFCTVIGSYDSSKPHKYIPSEFIKSSYDSFDEILALDNYDDIYSIQCGNCNLFELPKKLPARLVSLSCPSNNLTKLPDLPNTLSTLICCNNKLSYLPEYPKSIRRINCSNNELKQLPVHHSGLDFYSFGNNPIDNLIWDYFESRRSRKINFHRWNDKTQKKFANKIGEWFLNCKYNPKYVYCRNRLESEFVDLEQEYNKLSS